MSIYEPTESPHGVRPPGRYAAVRFMKRGTEENRIRSVKEHKVHPIPMVFLGRNMPSDGGKEFTREMGPFITSI